jgi:signal transduction histidine kinase
VKLSTFIDRHMETILSDWDAFASQQGAVSDAMSRAALRDHAREMLQAISLDIQTAQNASEQQQKSREDASVDDGQPESAAAVHGAARHQSHFSLLQLSAEFRALRATVLRLWLPQAESFGGQAIDEMIRFNEAIDQALAESIVAFSERAEFTQDLFLAVLGHDLRGPLATMALAGELLTRPDPTQKLAEELGARVKRSARVMGGMVDNLLGYTRYQFGQGLSVAPAPGDIVDACHAAIADARATYPDNLFELDAPTGLQCAFDPIRMHQLLINLLLNAAQYGAPGEPVLVQAARHDGWASIRVNNRGALIPESALREIFRPLVQLVAPTGDTRPKSSMGLGLFIAREIALAHGGTLEVSSSEATGTTFSFSIPLQ